MTIKIPNPSLVLLIGPSGSGKSTFAKRHFRPTEILSSDFCRALVSDDENDQTATNDAFELLHLILQKRLVRNRTTVIDATNVQPSSRASLLALAAHRSVPGIAIVFQLPQEVYQSRNAQRPNRQVPREVIANQIKSLAESETMLATEGFEAVYRLATESQVDNVSIMRAANS